MNELSVVASATSVEGCMQWRIPRPWAKGRPGFASLAVPNFLPSWIFLFLPKINPPLICWGWNSYHFLLRMTQECFQELAPTCVNPTSASHHEDSDWRQVHLNGFSTSDAWCFLSICTAVGFVLYVSVVIVSRGEKDRKTEHRTEEYQRIQWGDKRYILDRLLFSYVIYW